MNALVSALLLCVAHFCTPVVQAAALPQRDLTVELRQIDQVYLALPLEQQDEMRALLSALAMTFVAAFLKSVPRFITAR